MVLRAQRVALAQKGTVIDFLAAPTSCKGIGLSLQTLHGIPFLNSRSSDNFESFVLFIPIFSLRLFFCVRHASRHTTQDEHNNHD